MRKVFPLFLLVMALTSIPQEGRGQNCWMKRYRADDGYSLGHFIRPTSDGNYIVMGTYSGWLEPWLLKVDPQGDIIWTCIYDDDDLHWMDIYCVQETQDRGFVMTGLYYYSSDWDLLVVKTDSVGETLWTHRYGYEDSIWHMENVGTYIEPTEDGGYIVIGRTGDNLWHFGNPWLLKLDSLGDTLWSRVYGNKNDKFWGQSVRQLGDGGYIVLAARGVYITDPEQAEDTWLIRTDSLGDTLWTRLYEGIGAWSIATAKDGGFILTGETNVYGENLRDLCLTRTDKNGDVMWVRAYGTMWTEIGWWAEQTTDGKFIVVGEGNSISDWGKKNLWLLKVDENGDTVWTRLYGSWRSDWGSCLCQAPDGGYLVVGQTESWASDWSNYELWLLKVDSLGLGLPPALYAVNSETPHGYINLQKMYPECVFFNASPLPSKPFTCCARIRSLPDSTWIYNDEVIINDPMAPCADTSVRFKEWIAPEISEYEIFFYPTSNQYDTLETDTVVVKFYWSAIEEQPVPYSNWYVEALVSKEIVLQYIGFPKGFEASIFDASGRKVDEIKSPSESGVLIWGAGHNPGVYFISSGTGKTQTLKVVLVK